MTARITSIDFQDIICKLASDKAKAREEGIKLLNTWLDDERTFGFCKFLAEKSSVLKHNDSKNESWTFLIKNLVQCLSLEISSAKRRQPKLIFAKTLRVVVQHAESDTVSGESYALSPVARLLFNHALNVLRDVPSFQSEYAVLLRHLLAVGGYRFHMRKRVYSDLVLLFMEKVERSLSKESAGQSIPREDVFRFTLTLQSLLENPPGDIPVELRGDMVKGFVRIFSYVRDEGKLPKKLLECINTFLLFDGPNLGWKSFEIHDAVERFVLRYWFSTQDRGLKDALISYVKLQLSLTRGASDGSGFLEKLLDLVFKELDQLSCSNPDAVRDKKCGLLTGSQYNAVDLAALVFRRVLTCTIKKQLSEKRSRQEHIVVQVKERLIEGKWSWHAAAYFLIRNQSFRLETSLCVQWFLGLSENFDRIINTANLEHSYAGLLWTLRSLFELSSLLVAATCVKSSPKSSLCNELEKGWHVIWNSLMRSLPIFANAASVVDAALNLLCNIMLSDAEDPYLVPIEIWDLRIFRQIPSLSALCFITIYFSCRNFQGNVQEALHHRQNMLHAVLGVLNLKESSSLDEQLVFLVPAAAYVLCTGYTPLMSQIRGLLSSLFSSEAVFEWGKKVVKSLSLNASEPFECAVEMLSRIGNCSSPKVNILENYQRTHLSRSLREQLLHEMEIFVWECIRTKEIKNSPLSDLINTCALVSNFMCCSCSARFGEEINTFVQQLGGSLLDMLDQINFLIGETYEKLTSGSSGLNSIISNFETSFLSFKSFLSSPLLNVWKKEKDNEFSGLYAKMVQSVERLLEGLAKVYEKFLGCTNGAPGRKKGFHYLADTQSLHDPHSLNSSKSLVLDEELDLNSGSSDADYLAVDSDNFSLYQVCGSMLNQKLDFLQILSYFFLILPSETWDILFKLQENECEQKVSQILLFVLCSHSHWHSCEQLEEMVKSMMETLTLCENLKIPCTSILDCLCPLVEKLLVMKGSAEHEISYVSSGDRFLEEILVSLGDLINKVFENSLLAWPDRIKIVDCICNFVSLKPQIAQPMIEKLLILLRDPDYRVRICLARRIGILFQTWDGHFELFQDICLNLGVKLVFASKENIVKAEEILAVGPQSSPVLETAIITLMHLVLHSEKIELQAIFMICAVAAIEPGQRELVRAALDSLSVQLNYSNRTKYLEELMGPILFCWVACGVSLVSLVETRDLYLMNEEAANFLQYCCQWLLPALILLEDEQGIKFVAEVSSQPCADLVKHHFVHIFSICMALHCSDQTGSEKGTRVLGISLLNFAGICEGERDDLIKKHLVSIVNHSLSLASNVRDPPLPFFYKDIIASVIKTVVDGFVESVDQSGSHGLVDTINILRPDRVFMFIVDMHYKVTAAAHPRHKCNYFAGIEVLVNLLDHRAAVPSTFSYLLNLAGQYVDCHYLSVQCCHIVSTLLKISKDSLSEETNRVLGEQLQFLTSKLVACVASSEAAPHNCKIDSSLVVSLLQQITVSNDSSLHGYIKELGPFPEFDVLHGIREFQQKMSGSYSPRDHFLKLVKRSFSLPPRFLLCGLKALHSNMSLKAKHIEENVVAFLKDAFQGSDKEVVDASWNLVRVCSLQSPTDVGAMVSDFISKVGIRDPHRVSFYLPGESHVHACGVLKNVIATESSLEASTEISSEVVLVLFRLFKKYLMEDSVQIIDITSQVLRGILSTECGQKTLEKLDSYEKSLIKAHSRGVNLELVERLVGNLACKTTAKSLSIEDFSLWSTTGKTFEMWICPLVYTMISYCDDVILRLCHDIVLVKSEVAEFLFTHVIVNIAGREASHLDLCAVISSKVQECVFCESNMLIKSIQVTLCALNELRLCHVMVKMSAAAQNQHNIQKQSGPSSALKSHSVSAKLKNLKRPSGLIFSTLLWEKVYWLAIDYLLVAKAAVKCGSYFTAFLYVEHWCEQHFHGLNLGSPDFSHHETLPLHVEILVSVVTQINEPDSLYGIVQSHKLTSQVIIFEHEGNWTKALEYYDLQVRSEPTAQNISSSYQEPDHLSNGIERKRPYKGLIRSLEQMGCKHLLDVYCQGLTSQREQSQNDQEFIELQYEAAWRAGNWGFFPLYSTTDALVSPHCNVVHHFNGNLHSCLRSLQEGEYDEFHRTVKNSKQALLMSIFHASSESTEFIYSTILRLQIFYHLEMAWDLRWSSPCNKKVPSSSSPKMLSDPVIPSISQLQLLNENWNCILEQTGLHMNLLEPFIAFRRALLRVLNSVECTLHHLWKSASVLRKGSRISQAAAALHEFKLLCSEIQEHSNLYWLGRLEEAKLLRAQGRNEMAINLAEYISQNHQLKDEGPDVFRLVGKWLAETRSSNSRIILEKYLKHAVNLADNCQTVNKLSTEKRNQMHFHLAHYADLLFRSHEERLCSSEWQVAMRLRKHKKKELVALQKRFKSAVKGDREDYALKIQLLQKQLAMDQEEENKLQEDRDNLLCIALSGYKRCLIIGEKYDVRVVFRLISLWFSLSTRQIVIDNMLGTIKEVQSYKFIQLVYQIASRIGSTKLSSGPPSFQFAVLSLVKKLALDHPYHTIYQLLALANGDRIKDKQRSRNSFVVDMDKKIAAEDLLTELSSYHRAIISQMKEMVEIYIKLAEMETRREDTNRQIKLPRGFRSVNELHLVPVVTSHFPIDRTCQYPEGFFPHFKRLADTVTIMEGINAPKVVECLGSDGKWYRQLAKSGNDDLRQDAVMEQFFGLVNTFLSNNRDTWKRRLSIRTYKVIPFTPSAGVLEWVNGTFPLGEYLIGSARNGGAHGRYGVGDWTFMECRRKMTTETNKRFTFQQVCENFRPVMHHFFLERFLNPADWFERRLAYTRSVAASSMVGYIVGLGDRHARNILIDEVTAEVVHIDLGVAFEQGLMLKTPERVPFRLTRDIIDGMGVTGVEGVFRRCCEESLSVMRTNKDALLKIIEVFIHDPLYKWALSPLKALQRQKDVDDEPDTNVEDSDEDDFEGNNDAKRSLLRVKQKLDGYEDGEMRSVGGQVQQLIQDAIDPDRLCNMFPGWGAWL